MKKPLTTEAAINVSKTPEEKVARRLFERGPDDKYEILHISHFPLQRLREYDQEIVAQVEQKTTTGQPIAEAASNWISIEDRLPSIGEKVWVRFAKKNGEPRLQNPVKDADFELGSIFGQDSLYFRLGEHRNVYFSREHCPKAGLTHWQPRVGNIAPSPWIDPADIAPPPPKKFSPEECERRAERMRNFWRNRSMEEQAVKEHAEN